MEARSEPAQVGLYRNWRRVAAVPPFSTPILCWRLMRQTTIHAPARSRRIPRPAFLQALAAACALMLVVLCVRIVDGSFSSEPEAVDLDGQVWREWLTDVGVDGGAYQPPLWASNTAPPAADEEVAPIGGSPDAARFFRVDVTGYCSRVEETDADPFLTAMCTVTGIIPQP